MMSKRIYSIHILLATFIFLNGCGASNSPKTNVPLFTVNASMVAIQDISATQRSIASNICLALKSKSQNFKTTDFLGTHFVFQTKQKICGVDGTPANISSTLSYHSSDNSFHYNAYSAYFNDFAQTDVSGYLSQVCAKINNNQPISNTTSIGGTAVQINFFKDNMEGYTVQYFLAGSDGVSKMTSMETFKLRTQITYVKGNIMGMDEYYSKDTVCETDLGKTTHQEQTFVSH